MDSTLALMPMAMMTTSGLAPKLAARIDSHSTMTVGIALAAVGLALMALIVSVDGGHLSNLPGMLPVGIGMGPSMTPATEVITCRVSAKASTRSASSVSSPRTPNGWRSPLASSRSL